MDIWRNYSGNVRSMGDCIPTSRVEESTTAVRDPKSYTTKYCTIIHNHPQPSTSIQPTYTKRFPRNHGGSPKSIICAHGDWRFPNLRGHMGHLLLSQLRARQGCTQGDFAGHSHCAAVVSRGVWLPSQDTPQAKELRIILSHGKYRGSEVPVN